MGPINPDLNLDLGKDDNVTTYSSNSNVAQGDSTGFSWNTLIDGVSNVAAAALKRPTTNYYAPNNRSGNTNITPIILGALAIIAVVVVIKIVKK